jgi:ElaA protein
MQALSWTCARLDELGPRALYQALALRSQVFVVEQRCVFLDPDGLDLDPGVWQLLGHAADGELLACARLLAPGVKGPQQAGPMISRVVNAAAARGTGFGRQLMQRALIECERLWPGQAIAINAQAYLQNFYASLGFILISPPYDEDGISHVDMKKKEAP